MAVQNLNKLQEEMTFSERQEKAVKFLQTYFRGCHGYSYLWLINKHGKFTLSFNVDSREEISAQVSKALNLNDTKDYHVYFGVNVGEKPCNRNERHKKEDITEQVAIVADIDISDAAHHKGDASKYPADIDTAISFLPVKPTFIISSGGGIHAYYKFETPLASTTTADRDLAANRGKSLLDVIRSNAGMYEGIDGVHDLPRVLRLPYSFNCKDNKKLCTVIEQNDVLFTPAQIDELIGDKSDKKNLFKGSNSKILSDFTRDFKGLANRLNHCDIHAVADEYLQKADKGTFICPSCGSGSHGNHNTGLSIYRVENGLSMMKCFNCGINYTVMKVIAHCNNLDLTKYIDFKKALKIGCEIYGIDFESATTTDVREDFFIISDYDGLQNAQDNLKDFVDDCGGKWRGLTYEILKSIGAGFENKISPYVIFPNYEGGILKRHIEPLQKKIEKISPVSFFDVHSPQLKITDCNLLIVEGVVDALSIIQACNGQVYVIATDGIDNAEKTIKELAKLYPVDKPRLIFMFDNDTNDAGKKGAEKAVQFALSTGFIAANVFLTDEKDVDANKMLIRDGEKTLAEYVQNAIKAATPLLDEQAGKILPADLRISSELRKKLFTGDISDVSNAERLFLIHEDRLRYIYDREKWLVFDGQIWKIGGSSNSAVYPYAIRAGKILSTHAKRNDDRERRIANAFSTRNRINAAIDLLKGTSASLITQDDLNTHKHLLNCLNGVVDLQTGKLYPNRDPKLLITQMCNAEYHAGEYSQIVDNFFESILPNEDTRAALIRYLGYCLTGCANEEKAVFLRGPGGNGKGTLTQTLLKLFNNYGVAFPIKSLLMQRDSDAESATPTLAKLQYCRLACAEEIPQGRKLDAAKFKVLTGGDKIYFRRLHEEGAVIENPTQKFIVSGNYDIELSDSSDWGLKRRWIQIPFTQKFTENNCDLHLKEKLTAPDALNGLLSRLIDAAQSWYANGLFESAEMKIAKLNFFSSQNFIAEFFSENCEFYKTSQITLKEFLKRLTDSEFSLCRAYSDKALRDMIKKFFEDVKGVSIVKPQNLIAFKGIRWKENNNDFEKVEDDVSIFD